MKFHLNCKKRFDAYIVLLKQHNDIAGINQAETIANNTVNCGYCERPMNRRSNGFRNRKR